MELLRSTLRWAAIPSRPFCRQCQRRTTLQPRKPGSLSADPSRRCPICRRSRRCRNSIWKAADLPHDRARPVGAHVAAVPHQLAACSLPVGAARMERRSALTDALAERTRFRHEGPKRPPMTPREAGGFKAWEFIEDCGGRPTSRRSRRCRRSTSDEQAAPRLRSRSDVAHARALQSLAPRLLQIPHGAARPVGAHVAADAQSR